MHTIYCKDKNGNDNEIIISFLEGKMIIEQRVTIGTECTNDVVMLDKEQVSFLMEAIAENMLMESVNEQV